MKMPTKLGPAGRQLFKAVIDGFDLESPAEAVLLERACRTADIVAALESLLADGPLVADGRIRPELVELRLQTQQLSRLLVALRVTEMAIDGVWRRPQRRG